MPEGMATPFHEVPIKIKGGVCDHWGQKERAKTGPVMPQTGWRRKSLQSLPRNASIDRMSAILHYDSAAQLGELHISGILKRDEFASREIELAARITAGDRPRMLVVVDNFDGWAPGEDWNNLDFMFTHGEKIAKIAIVGAGTREDEMKAFTGAGMRPTPVLFFGAEEIDAARAWLLE